MNTMHKRPLGAIITFGIVLIANYTLGAGNTDLSVLFPFTVMPPGLTFAVSWGAIYGLISVLCVLLLLKHRQWGTHMDTVSKRWIITNILNIIWITLTYLGYYLASVFVIIALGVALYELVRYIISHHEDISMHRLHTAGFGLYLGWITLASATIGVGQAVSVFFPTIITSPTRNTSALIAGLIACRWVVRSSSPWVVFTPIRGLGMIGRSVLTQGEVFLGILARGAAFALLIPAYKARSNPYLIR